MLLPVPGCFDTHLALITFGESCEMHLRGAEPQRPSSESANAKELSLDPCGGLTGPPTFSSAMWKRQYDNGLQVVPVKHAEVLSID